MDIEYKGEHSIIFLKDTGHGYTKRHSWTAPGITGFYMIPSSRPYVSYGDANYSMIPIPGTNKRYDVTDYRPGGLTFGSRTGSWEFYIAHSKWQERGGNWADAYNTIKDYINGGRFLINLVDDPLKLYQGVLVVSGYVAGADYSRITIQYDLGEETMILNEPLEYGTFGRLPDPTLYDKDGDGIIDSLLPCEDCDPIDLEENIGYDTNCDGEPDVFVPKKSMDPIMDLRNWVRYNMDGFEITQNNTEYYVSGVVGESNYERLYYKRKVTPNTDYLFRWYERSLRNYTKRSDPKRETYAAVWTEFPGNRSVEESESVILFKAIADRGLHDELHFNSGDCTEVYITLEYSAAVPGTFVEFQLHTLDLYPRESVPLREYVYDDSLKYITGLDVNGDYEPEYYPVYGNNGRYGFDFDCNGDIDVEIAVNLSDVPFTPKEPDVLLDGYDTSCGQNPLIYLPHDKTKRPKWKWIIGDDLSVEGVDINGDGTADYIAFKDSRNKYGIDISIPCDGIVDVEAPKTIPAPDEGSNAQYIVDDNGDITGLDTDGDGDIDYNINVNEKYEFPIVTGDDGTIGIDTDGDGEPDIPIINGGDGNKGIDSNNDGEIDMPIVPGPDGTTGIDTDGDGSPDIPIKTNPDGTETIETPVVRDDDGTPGIDTDGDGDPDVVVTEEKIVPIEDYDPGTPGGPTPIVPKPDIEAVINPDNPDPTPRQDPDKPINPPKEKDMTPEEEADADNPAEENIEGVGYDPGCLDTATMWLPKDPSKLPEKVYVQDSTGLIIGIDVTGDGKADYEAYTDDNGDRWVDTDCEGLNHIPLPKEPTPEDPEQLPIKTYKVFGYDYDCDGTIDLWVNSSDAVDPRLIYDQNDRLIGMDTDGDGKVDIEAVEEDDKMVLYVNCDDTPDIIQEPEDDEDTDDDPVVIGAYYPLQFVTGSGLQNIKYGFASVNKKSGVLGVYDLYTIYEQDVVRPNKTQ